MALTHIIIRSPYTPYSIYLRETISFEDSGVEGFILLGLGVYDGVALGFLRFGCGA